MGFRNVAAVTKAGYDLAESADAALTSGAAWKARFSGKLKTAEPAQAVMIWRRGGPAPAPLP